MIHHYLATVFIPWKWNKFSSQFCYYPIVLYLSYDFFLLKTLEFLKLYIRMIKFWKNCNAFKCECFDSFSMGLRRRWFTHNTVKVNHRITVSMAKVILLYLIHGFLAGWLADGWLNSWFKAICLCKRDKDGYSWVCVQYLTFLKCFLSSV